jgi:cell cycle checkpoint protein
MELGGILKARDLPRSAMLSPPSSHQLFSKLIFVSGKSFGGMDMLNESDLDGREDRLFEGDQVSWSTRTNQEHDSGWLASDDIEEF